MTIFVLEVDAYDGAAETTLRYATHTLNTGPVDTPAHTTYKGVIADPGSLQRSVSLLGNARESSGGPVITNVDGGQDAVVNYGYGRPFRLKEIGQRGDSVGAATIRASGIVEGVFGAEPFKSLQFRWRDQARVLSTPLLTERYLGTTTSGGLGTAEGDTDLKGRVKPRVFGSASGVSPTPVNRFDLIWQVSAGAVYSIVVYDGGGSLESVGDYPTLASLIAATIPSGKVATCLALGLFRLGGQPSGVVTADVVVGETSADRSASAVARKMFELLIADGADVSLDGDSFDLLHDFNGAEVGIFVNDETRASDLIASVLGGVGAGLDPGVTGVFRVFSIDVPSGDPVKTFTLRDIIDGAFAFTANPEDEGGSVPAWEFLINFARNYTPLTNDQVVGSVSQERRDLLEKSYQEAVAVDETVLTAHPHAVTLSIDGHFVSRAAAEAEAERRLQLFKVRRDRVSITVPDADGQVDMGSIVKLQFPRFGYDAGKLMIVVGRKDDFAKRTITLELFG